MVPTVLPRACCHNREKFNNRLLPVAARHKRRFLFSRDLPGSSFFSSSMAALYEGYTLCGLVPGQILPNSGIQGVEAERDSDHVVVTDSTRSVTSYKVSLSR